jgi:hypothetical protein
VTTAHTVLTFKDIQDVVLESRFQDTTATRNRAKRMINSRYAQLVGMDDWTFRYATDPLSVIAGNRIVSGVISDFQAILGIWDSNGDPLTYLNPVQFFDVYQGDTGRGSPAHFTIINSVVEVAPTPDTSSSGGWQMFYRKKIQVLELDGDTPIIPVEYRYILVHGARADLLLDNQDPSWQEEDALWQAGIGAMRLDYLTDAEGEPAMWPADPTWG